MSQTNNVKPDWNKQGLVFGYRARKLFGMLVGDNQTDIKAMMALCSVTILPRFGGRQATTYVFQSERHLCVVVHHYHLKRMADRFVIAMYPLEKISGLCEIGMMNLIRQTIKFLGVNPDTPGFEYQTPQEKVGEG